MIPCRTCGMEGKDEPLIDHDGETYCSEACILAEHDKYETLHSFAAASAEEPKFCDECGDTAEGLMHDNTERNVEPLLKEG